MANATKKGGGTGTGTGGHQHVGTTDPEILDEHDLADEIGGRNRLQGEDQARNRNKRLTQLGSLDADNKPPDDPFAPDDGSDRSAAVAPGRRDRT